MHQAAFRDLGIAAEYTAVHVKEDQLADWVKQFCLQGGNGFSVTIPHKQAILQYLDEIDPLAARIGAVNAVLYDEGVLSGFNTDGLGFVQGINQFQLEREVNVLMIGAGGAARGIYYALLEAGYNNIVMANRTVEKAKEMTDHAISIQEAEEQLGDFQLVIQTTSVGMIDNELPLQLNKLRSETVVCDIIYNPLKTKFLEVAEQKGAVIQNGLEMFARQGACAFEIWTGQAPNIELMKKAVLGDF